MLKIILHLKKYVDDWSDLEAVDDVLQLLLKNVYKLIARSIPKRSRRSNLKRKLQSPKITEDPAEETAPHDISAETDINATLYQNYKSNMIMQGSLLWRVRSPSKDVLIMNDIESTTGTFKVRFHFSFSRMIVAYILM